MSDATSGTAARRGHVDLSRSRGARPSDAQLRSAADRIRRLSAGVMDPDHEAADLTTFAEEAIRRTHRIVELGVQFWMDLLRLDERSVSANPDSQFNSGWLYGRALGATVRSWGDLKNAERGHLWFDSSPLLGPRITEPEKQEDLEPLPRLLTGSAVHEIADVLSSQWPDDWSDGEARRRSRELLWLGLASGALERELRNPQVNSEHHLERRTHSALAFLMERDPRSGRKGAGRRRNSEPESNGLLTPSRTAQIKLKDRLRTLRAAQGGRDVPWRPLYSFLRRGDVVVITLASEKDGIGADRWGRNWPDGRPIALAIVTARPNWDRAGWWGRIGSVLFLDGPGAKASPRQDPERLRTAFRFPDPDIDTWSTSALALSFGFREATDASPDDDVPPHLQFKNSNDLGLERYRLFEDWVKASQEPEDGDLAEPIPVGFAGPWRNAPAEDLRATLGEFLDPHTETIRATEQAKNLSFVEPGFQANLNIERFALTGENVRLGVFFDQPVRRKGRASAQRIAPDPLPDPEGHEELALKDGASVKEGKRIDVANAHRWAFDNFKRGRPVKGEGGLGEASALGNNNAARRAASFMPAIRLDRSFRRVVKKTGKKTVAWTDLRPDQVFLMWTERELEWEEKEKRRKDPVVEFVNSASSYLSAKTNCTICAAFADSEKSDLDRATFSRAFREAGLRAEDAEVPIDPAGTRTRRAVLITKKETGSRLLIILTDDSVAAVDVGAIVWLLLAYDKLEPNHVLDLDANATFREQAPGFNRKNSDPQAEARNLQTEAFNLLAKCVP